MGPGETAQSREELGGRGDAATCPEHRLHQDTGDLLPAALTQRSGDSDAAELAETEKELNGAALMQFSAGKGTAAQEVMQLARYVEALEKQRRERLERCLLAEKESTLASAALEKAAREREILDRVHEHQKKAHGFHVARQEQKWMDELALQIKRGLLATA